MSLPNILMRNRRPDGSVPQYLPDRLGLERGSDSPLQRAANYFQEAVRIAREIGDYRAEARQLGNLGTALFKQGNIDRALDCFKQALAISEHVADRDNQVTQLENIKSSYESMGNKKEAHGIEARLKELSKEGSKPAAENALEKFGSAGIIPFHEQYWRASQEEEYQKYWSEYYRAHIGG
jgi:tetratricopeptide (TPR) repeat protein